MLQQEWSFTGQTHWRVSQCTFSVLLLPYGPSEEGPYPVHPRDHRLYNKRCLTFPCLCQQILESSVSTWKNKDYGRGWCELNWNTRLEKSRVENAWEYCGGGGVVGLGRIGHDHSHCPKRTESVCCCLSWLLSITQSSCLGDQFSRYLFSCSPIFRWCCPRRLSELPRILSETRVA